MLVARVGGLERIGAGIDAQHDVRDVLEFELVHARADIDAIAGVIAHALGRNAAQCMVQQLDRGIRPAAALGDVELGMRRIVARQLRIIDLQDEAGIDNCLVFLVERVGHCYSELLVRLIELVPVPAGELGRRHRRHKGFLVGDAGESSL